MIAVAITAALGAAVPQALPFTDSSGEHVTLARYFQPHRPVVLVIAYARCRMLCNVVLRGLADSIHSTKLEPGRDYLPIVISLDPKETPDEAARRQATLLELAGVKDRTQWPYLVGDVAPLAAALDFHYSWDPHTEQFIHPAEVFVISPDGHVSAELKGIAYPELAAAIRGDALPPDSSELLRCFHYDPSLTRYRGRLQNFFRLGAATVFFALLVGLGAIVRRRR